MVIQLLQTVPDWIFDPAAAEIDKINWGAISDPTRRSQAFVSSTAVHIRVHKTPGIWPTTIEEWSEVVDCIDQRLNIKAYPDTVKLMNWVAKQVAGIQLGRVMIVRLEAGGSVGLHTDTGKYFKVHSRFHVPIKTNHTVLFGNEHVIQDHMPARTLCRLNNLEPHRLQNNGNDYRIHVIVDVACPGGNQIF